MEKVLYSESIPWGPFKVSRNLQIVVLQNAFENVIKNMEEQYSKYLENPYDKGISLYMQSYGQSKTRDKVLKDMSDDIKRFKRYAKGIIAPSPIDRALEQISEEIYKTNRRFEIIHWAEYFAKLPRKKDGTFVTNRVVRITKANGFSYEVSKFNRRKGLEIIIKTLSPVEAQLMIRTGRI